MLPSSKRTSPFSSSSHHHQHALLPPTSLLAKGAVTATAMVAAATATYLLLLKPFVTQYGGLSGTLRFLWEGDHLPPEIRECVDELQEIEHELKKEKRTVHRIKILIETAKLNSVDNDDDDDGDDDKQENKVVEKGETSSTSNASQRSISSLSHSIENDSSLESNKFTSKETISVVHKDDAGIKKHYILCQIPSLSTDLGCLSYNLDKLAARVDGVESHGNIEVKTIKKELSSKIVEMMKVCDDFLKECGIETK